MNLKPWLLLILVLGLCHTLALAENIVVTSRNDSGPGTLREALTRAAANGTSQYDYILFNLPGSSNADRTINLAGDLPNLSSKLIIDATSQPGSTLGVSQAKVIIQPVQPNRTNKYCFNIDSCSFVEIYGLVLKNFTYYTIDYPGGSTQVYPALMPMSKISHIRIGAPGKGNVFCGSYGIITKNHFTGTGDNIIIQSNFIGVDVDGRSMVNAAAIHGGLNMDCNVGGIALTHVGKVLVGGDSDAERNIISGIHGTPVTFWESFDTVIVRNNYIGTDVTGDSAIGVHLGVPTGPLSAIYNNGITIIDRNILVNGITFNDMKNTFYIQRNIIGLDKTKTKFISNRGLISINYNYHLGIIGGPDPGYGNTIANAVVGIANGHNSRPLKISHNSIFCPQYEGIAIAMYGGNDMSLFPFVNINRHEANHVSGTASPNSQIELFYDDECVPCSGKTFITKLMSDANGRWEYNGPINGTVLATATRSDSATSEFSKPRLDAANVQITPATCSRSNGSIKGIKILSGTKWHWENSTGQIISTDTNLLNVPPGTYRLVIGLGNGNCVTRSNFFTVTDVPPPFMNTNAFQLTHPTCGLFNGKAMYTALINPAYLSWWENESGTIVASGPVMNNAGPGNYYFIMATTSDSTCKTRSPMMALVNQSGPTLHTTSAQITHASCGNDNGSIRNITTSNVTGTPVYRWLNAAGTLVATTPELLNAAPGQYLLKFKDASTCDTIVTSYFTIQSVGNINIDTSQTVVTSSQCAYASGTITGIQVTGADAVKWYNAAGQVISQQLNPGFLMPGKYVLEASNSYGCTKKTDSITVPVYPFFPISPSANFRIEGRPGTCDANNGYVRAINFPDPQLYTFRWVDSANQSVVLSTTLELTGFNSGTFYMYAKNAANCEQKVLTARLVAVPAPRLDSSRRAIKNDACTQSIGSITGIVMVQGTGMQPFRYRWYDENNNLVDTFPDLMNRSAGRYRLQVTDRLGCTVNSPLYTVLDNPLSLPAPLYDDQLVPRNTSVNLIIKNLTAGGTYQLHEDLNSPVLTQSETGQFLVGPLAVDKTYYIRQVAGTCASTFAMVKVKVYDDTRLTVPNAFSPNNDGINDTWIIKTEGIIREARVRIFNRYGQQVYNSFSISAPWDGRFNGTPLPVGTYYWTIEAVDLQGKQLRMAGPVTLLR
jgi:gliding motility-associated-like protein